MDHDKPREAERTTRRFPRAAASVGQIRGWLRERLSAARVTSDVVEVAELLISEVATNAVDHGAGDEIVVHLTSDGHVETAVHDQDTTGTPRPGQATADDVRGRGLGLVQALATSWGVHPTRTGKWVWFRLSTRHSDPSDPCDSNDGSPLPQRHGDDFPGRVNQPPAGADPSPGAPQAPTTQRQQEIGERIEQLHERSRQFTDRRTKGSTPQQAADARQHALAAHEHAGQAHQRAAQGRDDAADLHDRAAAVLDEHGEPERAQDHRDAADQDRAAAGDDRRAADHDTAAADDR